MPSVVAAALALHTRFRVAEEAVDRTAQASTEPAEAVAVVVDPGCVCADMFRRTVECSDYTSCHLPDDWFGRCWTADAAKAAIFAARMAFSSLWMRSRLK